MQPEYLELFQNSGPVKVSVRFSAAVDKHRSIADAAMQWHDLERLIDQSTGMFYNVIRFDSYECSVKKYEIDPLANSLTIVVAKTDLP
jgi:hypothetical protein